MEVLSILIGAKGSIRTIDLSALQLEHVVIAARVRIGEDIKILRPLEGGQFSVQTPIGVKWFDDYSEDVTASRLDMFYFVNKSRIEYPEIARGRHEIDDYAVSFYTDEAVRRIEPIIKARTAMNQNKPFGLEDIYDETLSRMDALEAFRDKLAKRLETYYINEYEYQELTRVMIENLVKEFSSRRKKVVLLLDEDANSPGNLVAFECWNMIRPFVSGVVVGDRLADKSKKAALRHEPHYLAFFDAMFTGNEMRSRVKTVVDFEKKHRPNSDFSILIACPIDARVGGATYGMPNFAGRPVSDYLKIVSGHKFKLRVGEDRDFMSEALDEMLGSSDVAPVIYTDRFYSHIELPVMFLSGGIGSLDPGRAEQSEMQSRSEKSETDLDPLIQNFYRDFEILSFAASIDYKFYAHSKTGELKERSVSNMSDVLFPQEAPEPVPAQ